MQVRIAVDPGRSSVKVAAVRVPEVEPASVAKVPSVAWQRPGEGLLVGFEAEQAAREQPEHLLVGWMERLFSFRLLGGIDDPDLGFTAAGVLALLLESPIREAIHGLGVDPAQIDLVSVGLVVPHRWSALQQDAAARVLNQVVEEVCPAAVIGMVRIADVEALDSILGTEHDDGTLILDVGTDGEGHGGAGQQAPDADILTSTASALAIQEDGGARVDRILLVGGGALDPGLRRRLEQEFSRDTRAVVDPELTAVMGGLEVLEQAAPGRVALVPPEAGPAPAAAQERRGPVALLVGGGLAAAVVAAAALYLSGALSGGTPATVPERPWITTPALPVQPPAVDQQMATSQARDSATSAPTSEKDTKGKETTDVTQEVPVEPNESASPAESLIAPVVPAPVPAPPSPPLTNSPLPTGSPIQPAPVPTIPVPTAPVPTSPVPTSPVPTSPVPTTPVPTSPVPTDPGPTDPVPTDPGPTTPAPTTPVPTDPGTSEPPTGAAPTGPGRTPPGHTNKP